MPVPNPSIVGFIDLLASKESSKVSSRKLLSKIEEFLGVLVLNQVYLPNTKCEFRYLSDSAFFEIEITSETANYLQRVRKDLFDQRSYFKCAIVPGKLNVKTVGREFIKSTAKRKKLTAPQIEKLMKSTGNNFSGFYFSQTAVDAFELHEKYKGIGYIVKDSLFDSLKPNLIDSFWFNGSELSIANRFYDISFDNGFELGDQAAAELAEDEEIPEESGDEEDNPVEYNQGMSYIQSFLDSMRKSNYKSKNYSRYYLPTLISMTNSSTFENLKIEEKKISGAPAIYRKLVSENLFSKISPKIPGSNKVLLIMLNAALQNFTPKIEELERKIEDPDRKKDDRENDSNELDNLVETTITICNEFDRISGFKVALRDSTSHLLSASNREAFLEHVLEKR